MEYPEGASGDTSVELILVIDRAGGVEDVRAETGAEPFVAAALSAARRWQFVPARRGAVTMPARIRFRVEFRQEAEEIDLLDAGSSAVAPVPAQTAVSLPEPIEVKVTGLRKVGSKTISRAFALQLPGAFGNPFAAIGSAPGVTPTLSGAPYFYVRGSPPGNLGYLLDGLRLPALFHVLAGPSVVHPGLVQSVDFFAGPYPARYGRFTGGIAAGQLRPAEYALHGEVSVRAFDASGLVELPLSDHTSATVGGRVSYANPIARLFAPDISVSYWDYQLGLSHELSPRDELMLLGFGSRDALDREDEDGRRRVVFGAEFHRVLLRYQRELDAGSAQVALAGGWDRSRLADGSVTLTDTIGQLRAGIEHQLAADWRLEAGADLGLDRYTLEIGELDDPESRDEYVERYPARTDKLAGGYLSANWRGLPALSLLIGGRVDVYRAAGETALGPAASIIAEFALSPEFRLIHGLGVAHQPPSSNVPQPGTNPVLGQGLQHAVQSSAGFEWDLPFELELEATLFQVALFNLSDSIGISRIDNGDETLDDNSRSTGSSRGLELQLERGLSEDLGGYLSYTLSSSERSAGRAQGPSLFDRRHVLSGAMSYRWGRGFHGGLRGTFYTGVPADVAYLAAAREPPRTTPFYRLDLRLEKRWPLGEQGAYWAAVLEVLNTTLREEALGKSCNAYVCREDRVGPLTVPSLGFEAVF